MYTKGAANYISGRGVVSRCSHKVFTIEKMDKDMTLQKYRLFPGLKRRKLQHELLMAND